MILTTVVGEQYVCSYSKRHCKNRTTEHADQNRQYLNYTAWGLREYVQLSQSVTRAASRQK